MVGFSGRTAYLHLFPRDGCSVSDDVRVRCRQSTTEADSAAAGAAGAAAPGGDEAGAGSAGAPGAPAEASLLQKLLSQ